MLAGFGVTAAAHLPEGGLYLSHVVELVLIVTVTTNFMQFCFSKCNALTRSVGSHLLRFAPFYLATLAAICLTFPKADVVVGDLMPSTRSFTYLPKPKQHSAIVGTASIFASCVALMWVQKLPGKGEPLLATS